MRSIVLLGVLALSLSRPASADEVEQQIKVLLAGPGPHVTQAVERLRYLGAARSGPALRKLLVHPSADVRILASDALVRVVDVGSGRALAGVLRADSDWEVRRNAADALGAIAVKKHADVLGDALLTDVHKRVRKSAAIALGKLSQGAAALAKAAADDSDLEVRLAALDALVRKLDRTTTTALRALLRDSSSMIRFATARALAANGDAAGRSFLTQALMGDDDESASRAVLVIRDISGAWGAEQLANGIARSGEVGFESAWALAQRADERGVRALVLLSEGEDELAFQAYNALNALGVDAETRQRLSGRDK